MLLSGIILVLSSLGLITMVAYRSWEIKKGRLTVLEDVPERFFFYKLIKYLSLIKSAKGKAQVKAGETAFKTCNE